MKLATVGVCLAGTWAHASPHGKHGVHHKPKAELAYAMRDAVADAIKSELAKVHHHHQAQAPHAAVMEELPAGTLQFSLGQEGSKSVPTKISAAEAVPHNLLAKGKSLRGTAGNPWEPVKPLRILDPDMSPVAPMDRITPGIEAQTGGLLPPGYHPRAVYYPPTNDIVNSFPQHYSPPVPAPVEDFLVCKTAPEDWVDKKGFGCDYYKSAQWCTETGQEGLMWKKQWGTLAAFARGKVGAGQACCQCGGGARMSVVGGAGQQTLAERHLLAPTDRLPDPSARWFERNNGYADVPNRPLRPVQAPEDSVGLPTRVTAPLDRIGQKYARYFNEIHDMGKKADPRGFSVRYYTYPPNECSAKAAASAIDLGLDYQSGSGASLLAVNSSSEYSPVGFDAKSLQWPTNQRPVGGVYWAKWSGTLNILDPGRYVFNLNMGFSSASYLKIDGTKILTNGQCRVSADGAECAKKGCKWNKATGACTAAPAKKVAAAASGQCPGGKYRAWPILFSCEAQSGAQDVQIDPSGATVVLEVPPGVKDFQITAESNIDLDLQMKEKGKNKPWIVKFNDGIVNNQQRDGKYKGMVVSFSGDNPSAESAKLAGVSTAKIEVSLMSYSANPEMVKLVYSHGGCGCKGKKVKGCEKLPKDAAKNLKFWAGNMTMRYGSCATAWLSVKKTNIGGVVSWTQFQNVWGSAWEQMSGPVAKPSAWKAGFAKIDSNHDGYMNEAEFMKACGKGAPGAPAAVKAPKKGKYQDVTPIIVDPNCKDGKPKPSGATVMTNDPPSKISNVEPIIINRNQGGSAPKFLLQEVSSAPAPAPASAPAGPPEENYVDLISGGHCIEAMVMVTPSARNLQLTYKGPDSHEQEAVIPGQLVTCDPASGQVPACALPERDVCHSFTGCPGVAAPGPSPGPAPGPAPR